MLELKLNLMLDDVRDIEASSHSTIFHEKERITWKFKFQWITRIFSNEKNSIAAWRRCQ